DILLADELDYFRETTDSAMYQFEDLYINPTVNNNYVAGVNNAMFVYFEIFDSQASNQNANITYSIFKQSGELVSKVEANQLMSNQSNRIYKFYNVAAKFGSGSFVIKVEINYRNLTKYIEKMFTVSIPSHKMSLLKYQIPIEKQVVRYLLNATGKKLLKTLNNSQVVDFINQFWINKAKLEGKTVAELRNQLDKEIDYIRQYTPKDQFYIFGDFAAIIIQYGIPAFLERRTESSTSLAYIELSYNDSRRSIDGDQVRYYFADINQNGRLVLVHSTDKYYLQDPNWQKRLRRMSK
ncbi:MAG: hypothetical protein KDD94_02275, partial [Calditrichaeota bacterium]|nr:hypothetical protein [Calditrichota bacterium]